MFPVVCAQDDSEVLQFCTTPTVLIVGRRFAVEIPFKNLGESVWTKAEGYSLGLIDPIGTNCTGYELNENDAIAPNETKRFQLSCIPQPSDINKTTMAVRMMRDGEYFGETGIPCTFLYFKVLDRCEHNAINDICNIYCGADGECHNLQRNSSIDPEVPELGFCDEECMFISGFVPETTTTTTITTTTLPTQIECPEGYTYEDGVCVYRPSETIVCPEGSTYSETYGGCTVLPDPNGLCPEGYQPRADVCLYSPETQAECPTGSTYLTERSVCVFYPTSEEDCPEGYELVGKICQHIRDSELTCPEGSTYFEPDGGCITQALWKFVCPVGFALDGETCIYSPKATEDCPEGSTFFQEKSACIVYPNAEGGCPAGYVLEEELCIYRPSEDLHCPAGSRYSAVAMTCAVRATLTAYCPAAFELKNGQCIYYLSRTCGNGIIDGNELCDYNADITKWKAERSACRQGKSAALKTCSKDCQPVYYPEKCIIGKCGADCLQDQDCNDGNDKTADRCNISGCTCTYTSSPAAASKGIMALLKKIIIALSIIAAILFAVFLKLKISGASKK